MKKFKDIANEEVFNHHIVQGNTEDGKVAHTGTLKQMQKKIRDPKMGSDHVLVKTRHDLKTGDNWKKHMHAESVGDIIRNAVEEQELAEAVFWQIKIPGIPDPVFIESISKASIRKGLRSQLKPDVWKETEIERITKPAMVKMYRRLAKEGPSDESEEQVEEETNEKLSSSSFAASVRPSYKETQSISKKKEKRQQEDHREPRIQINVESD